MSGRIGFGPTDSGLEGARLTGDRFGQASMLLSEGERLGWVFRDRRQFYRPFAEPAPVLADVPPHIRGSAVRARNTGLALIIVAVVLWASVMCCFGLVLWGAYSQPPSTGSTMSNAEMRGATLILAGVVTGLVVAIITVLVIWRHTAGTRIQRYRRSQETDFRKVFQDWQARNDAYHRAEAQRVDALVEWGTAGASRGARRIDVVGGNLWGWEALLTVFGTSMLATRGGLTLVDLSGEAVGGELIALAAGNDISVDVQQLPAGLGDTDLLAGLSHDELVNVLVESMHGGGQLAERTTRSMDRRILDMVVGALGDDTSIGRVVAGVRVAMGEPGPTPELTQQERLRIGDELFSDEYRRQVHENLRRIESFLHPLRALRSRQPRPAAQLTCLAVVGDDGTHAELLKDLVVQWLARRITASPDASRTLVIAGADDLRRNHVERIADICERRSVRLVLLFRHLREASLQVLGAGSVVFMKLGNHEEATRAADFIGRQHKFVLTSLTANLGGSQTHSSGTNEGQSVGYSGQAKFYTGITSFMGFSDTWNTGRSWGTSASYAETVNFSNTEGRNRVYEYTVEPRTLQDLPDYAMLLVEPSPRGPMIQALECNPEIVMLPRSSMAPLAAPEAVNVSVALGPQAVRG
jgi:hypothetical protein